jgi:cytochrome P450
VEAILRDRRFGRQITHLPQSEALALPPEPPELKPFYEVDRRGMLELEPPAHTRLRGLVQKAFMARQIERLRPRIAELSHQLIDKMESEGSDDLLAAFATPIPVIMITEMLGVPTEMSDQFLTWSHTMVRMYQVGRTKEDENNAVQATQEFTAYLKEFIALRREQPQDDLITQLIQVTEGGEKLTEEELIANCILLLNAGHEATVNVIGNGVLALLNYPDQMESLRQNSDLIEPAVEELLRFDTPLHLFKRWVLDDLQLGGQNLKFGDQVAVLLGAANHDPAVFAEPEKLNFRRENNPHVSFGLGVHYCLGAPLARLELQTALPILLERLPDLQLADQPQFMNSYHFRGLEALPVSW